MSTEWLESTTFASTACIFNEVRVCVPAPFVFTTLSLCVWVRSPLLPLLSTYVPPLCSFRQRRGGGRQRAHSIENVPCGWVTSPRHVSRGSGSGDTSNVDAVVAHCEVVYCDADTEINDILAVLHDDLRRGVAGTQLEIDRYLFAVAPVGTTSLPRRFMVLLPW